MISENLQRKSSSSKKFELLTYTLAINIDQIGTISIIILCAVREKSVKYIQ